MSLRCPTCGVAYGGTTRFCPRDGTRLVADDGSPTADPAGAPVAIPTPARARAPAAAAPPGRSPGASPAARPPTSSSAKGPARSVPTGQGPAFVKGKLTPAGVPAHASLIGQALDGRFLIERKLGEGGMSFVYLATQTATGTRHAIKVLSPSLSKDATAMARLRREAELAGQLIHPNVCHIEYLGQTPNGLVYLVMPFLDGEILSDRTYRFVQLPLAEVVGFVAQIAAGLQAAHDRKIVHRDLKPENVMIVRGPDDRERAVVMDFGLAKERRAGPELERLTATGIVLGTPEFMSPEQLRGKALDGRTDVYSLALMTVEMLTGSLPFTGKSQQELMIARLRNHPTPLRKLRPDLDFPSAVERVLLKALERDPNDRFATAPDFAAALDAASQPGTLGTTTAALKRWFG
jgi:eukaryotic-like serine/threonine-protein kinase